MTLSSLAPGANTNWPQCLNRKATEPSAPRLPPCLVKAWRTSATVRVRLSVRQSTITAAPPGAVAFVARSPRRTTPSSSPVPRWIARVTLSLVMLASRALSSVRRSRGLLSGSPPPSSRRDGDLLDQAREHLALLRIRRRLAVLDVRPFAVTGHVIILPSWPRPQFPLYSSRRTGKRELLPAAGARQPPRPDHRRDRHRQDGHAADARAELLAIGVPVFMADVKGDLSGLAQGRRRATRRSPSAPRASSSTIRLRRLPGGVLGRLRRERPPGARDDLRHGAAAALARMLNLNDTQEGVLNAGVQDRRRPRACCCST